MPPDTEYAVLADPERERPDAPDAAPDYDDDDPLAGVPATEKPNEAFLRDFFSRQWRLWRKRRDKDQEVRDRIYRDRTPSGVGPNGEGSLLNEVPVRTGVLKTLLREYSGILGSESPRFEVLAARIGPKAQKLAEEVEQWTYAVYRASGAEENQNLVDADQIAYGRGVRYVAFPRQYWAAMPRRRSGEDDDSYIGRVEDFKRRAPVPIKDVHCPAPQTLFDSDEWDDAYGVPNCVFWTHRLLSDLATQYPTGPNGRGKSKAAKLWAEAKARVRGTKKAPDDPLMLFVCFANRRWQCYAMSDGVLQDGEVESSRPLAVIDQEIDDWAVLSIFEHGQKQNPFTVQLGDVSGDAELVHRIAGLFDNSLHLIDQLDDVLTQYATAVRRFSRAQPVVTRDWGPGGQDPYGYDPDTKSVRKITYNPDVVLQFGPGERPGWWAPDLSAHQAAIELHQILSTYLQRDTLAPSSWGGSASTESGYHLNTLIATSERKLKALLRRKVACLEGWAHRVYALVEEIGDSDGIPVKYVATEAAPGNAAEISREGWVVLKPKVAGKARVRVHCKPRLDTSKASNAQLGIQILQLVSDGKVDVDPAFVLEEYLGITNPAFHQRAAILSRILKSDASMGWLQEQVLTEAQMIVKQDDQMLAAQMAGMDPLSASLVPGALQAVMQARGLMPGAPATPGTGDGGSGLNSLLSQVAPQGAPMPGGAMTMPGSPGQGAFAAQLAGGMGRPPSQGVPGGLGAAMGAAAYGQPRGPAEGV